MNNSIIENEYINLENLYHFICNVILKYSKIFLFGIIIFTIYFFIKTPSYSSEVSFYTNYIKTGPLSSLSFINNLTTEKPDDLGFSISNYLASEKLLQYVVEQEYDIDGDKKTLVEYWGSNYSKIVSINPIATIKKTNRYLSLGKNLSIEEKKLVLAKEGLKNSIIYSEDEESSLHTINLVVIEYPQLSKDILDEIFESILDYSNEVTNVKAKEKKNFIQGRLFEIKEDLENSENEMRSFLEKNKNLSSPSLVLKKNRLQRNITLYSQLYVSLSDQLEISKIDEKDNTSSIVLLDSPNISPYKANRGFLESIVILFILLFMIFALFEAYKNKNQLFI